MHLKGGSDMIARSEYSNLYCSRDKIPITVFARWDKATELEQQYIDVICRCLANFEKNSFYIIHGGGPGVMSDLAKTAKQYGIFTLGIGTREYSDESKYSGDIFFMAPDIFERMRLLTSTPLTIVLPNGGTGTVMEMLAVLERIRIFVRREKDKAIPGNGPYLIALGDLAEVLEFHISRTFKKGVPFLVEQRVIMLNSMVSLREGLTDILSMIKGKDKLLAQEN